MRLKIVSLSKFIRSILIVLGLFLLASLFISNKSFSHKDIEYKTICVSYGDTLWSIAKDEKGSNPYYDNKDIRDVVDNIKSINKLSNSDISVNQKLIIPYI